MADSSEIILLDDFIDWYRPRMAYLKFIFKLPLQTFILTVNRMVWRMVRDYLLVQKAKSKWASMNAYGRHSKQMVAG